MERRMKLAKFITIAVFTILFFVAAWIMNGIAYNNLEDANSYYFNGTVYWPYLAGAAAIIMIIAFSVITLNVVIYSLVRFFKSIPQIKHERGLWKILTICFNAGLLTLSVFITIFWIVWLVYICKDGFNNPYGGGIQGFFEHFGAVSISYINDPFHFNYHSVFGVYVTSFVFLLIWCAAGIVFEVLKKVLGGYKAPSNNEANISSNDSYYPSTSRGSNNTNQNNYQQNPNQSYGQAYEQGFNQGYSQGYNQGYNQNHGNYQQNPNPGYNNQNQQNNGNNNNY